MQAVNWPTTVTNRMAYGIVAFCWGGRGHRPGRVVGHRGRLPALQGGGVLAPTPCPRRANSSRARGAKLSSLS
eukprot:6215854-Pyramimonas_sp.AAC.1